MKSNLFPVVDALSRRVSLLVTVLTSVFFIFKGFIDENYTKNS